jgi:hypothetical protein
VRILFTTRHESAVSTQINLTNFERLAEVDGVNFAAFRRDYQNFDIVLFMGYDPCVAEVREVNPDAKIGVVDVRPTILDLAQGADFLVSNGPEMSAMAARYFSNVFEYPIYQEAKHTRVSKKEETARVVITYHGNRAHAVSMFPHVTRALEELAREVPLELQLIFNREKLSDIPARYLPRDVEIKIINWYEDVYDHEIAEADIGIAPNLTPMHQRARAMRDTAPRDAAFGAHETEFLHRYKCTSNAGRILAFAQHGIPVVADMHPSSAQIIFNGENGYLASDSYSWYQALRALSVDQERRRRMGRMLRRTFDERYRIPDINQRFVGFLRALPPAAEAPVVLGDADDLFEKADMAPDRADNLAKFILRLGRRWAVKRGLGRQDTGC